MLLDKPHSYAGNHNPRHVPQGYGSRSVCVCLSVCLSLLPQNQLPTLLVPHFYVARKFYRALYGVFNVFTVRLSLKHFVQEFWHYLPVTAAFLAPWQAFNEQTRQQWLLFNSKSVYGRL